MNCQEYAKKNLTVILRTVGERTEKLCYELIQSQVPEENISIVRESPFTEALRKTFEIGIRENRTWTFVVDADVLLKQGVIEELLSCAEGLDSTVFEIEGKIIDKFLDSPREAGNHLYRTPLLSEALKLIPDPLESLRPETHVKNAMQKKGNKWLEINTLVGFHDFEQYYRDIYRKSFVYAKKHKKRIPKIISQWEKAAELDLDFKVAMEGLKEGNKHAYRIAIEKNPLYEELFNEFSERTALSEKENIQSVDGVDEMIKEILSKLLILKDRIINDQYKEMREIKNTYSYKIGRFITFPLRLFLHKQKNKI